MDVKIILKNHSTIGVREHIPSGFSMTTISSFKDIEYKHNTEVKIAWKSFMKVKRACNEDN